jgi:hypothetical protein
MKTKITLPTLAIILTGIVTVLVASNINWGKNKWKGIIEVDGKGYYAYLPAVFIYNDLNFGFFDRIEKEEYYNENLYYDYRSSSNGKTINKYYCGTAVTQVPFFLVAHVLSYLLDFKMDGYSKLYPIAINIAGLFYLLVGLYYLGLTLKSFGVSEFHRSLTLVAAAFGTNLFYYSVVEPGMSHVYSFAFISSFLYYAGQYFKSFEKKHILFLAFILGLIILIRPINGLIVLSLPFIAGSFDTLKKGFQTMLRFKIWLSFSVVVFLVVVSIQLIIYKLSTGSYFVYAYGDEVFNFLSPHVWDILFSYKKGLFLYTPIFLLSLLGGYFLWKSSGFEFFSWFGFFFLITYVFSSWWMWYYGGSFSSRVYVEYISLFMILLGITLSRLQSKAMRRIYISLVVFLIVICQIQTYQYRYYQIHWSEMTKEKYWDVFLRLDRIK